MQNKKIKTCKSSEKEISRGARKLVTVALALVIIGGAMGCSSNTTAASTDATTASTDTSKSNAPTIYKIGDSIGLKDYKITVNGTRTSNGSNDFDKPKDGNQYLMVDCTIENVSNEDQTVSSMLMFKVVDKDGVAYDQAIMAETNGKLDGTIAPTRKIKGEYCVEIPQGKTGLELEFDSSLIDNKQVIVELN